MKPNNTIVLKCTEDSFLRTWMEFFAPFHKMTPRERDVAARVLKQYFRLLPNVEDPEVLKEILWSRTSQKDMMTSLGMKPAHFHIQIASLKKAGFIVDDEINPKYIPRSGSDPRCIMCVVFDWSNAFNRIIKQSNAQE